MTNPSPAPVAPDREITEADVLALLRTINEELREFHATLRTCTDRFGGSDDHE
ncbi:hypothetical protein SAMN04487819_11519 [Actinopolyspora alba]|uniref:Uncharacterized protein n=1 Tax=Actinopolyspora alba TaxID=673379 RepID=A0A1I2B1U0_9ACTN|nr:hypothetical protein [Actinopolyspora alba]SFE49967.1 hypothetical protein SAMN04487819_11519 [Actinopolyspora alba]